MQNFKFAKVKMYADNLTVYAVVNNVNELNFEMNLIIFQNGEKKWQLNIYFEKCHVIHFSKKKSTF